jgi:hypothetical protein
VISAHDLWKSVLRFHDGAHSLARKHLRADHLAGAAFVGFGIAVFALSGDLPMGGLSMPGAGFLPRLIAALMIVLGLALIVRAHESGLLAGIEWSDLRHAASVCAITAVGIVLYERLGFIITMIVMVFGLLVLIERRNVFRAAVYSVVLVGLAFALFDKALRAPLPVGPFGF